MLYDIYIRLTKARRNAFQNVQKRPETFRNVQKRSETLQNVLKRSETFQNVSTPCALVSGRVYPSAAVPFRVSDSARQFPLFLLCWSSRLWRLPKILLPERLVVSFETRLRRPARSAMYKDYYRLHEEPFNITPDPRFLFLTDKHRQAMEHVLYGIRQRKGFICLTGEVGAGKTTLCRALLNELKDNYHTALILNPMLSQTQLLRAIIQELGIVPRRRDRLGYMQLLNEFLLAANSQGKDVVLVVDEVQDMPNDTLELTRLLSNLETASQKLLQIVLVGQPELREKLARPKFRQLSQRITVWYHLGTMSSQETGEYLRYRLKIAGAGDELLFEPAAVQEIFQYSQGTPRLINAISDKALLAGYVYQTACIDAGIVQLAIRELKEAC